MMSQALGHDQVLATLASIATGAYRPHFKSCDLAIHVDSSADADALIADVEAEHRPALTGCFVVGQGPGAQRIVERRY